MLLLVIFKIELLHSLTFDKIKKVIMNTYKKIKFYFINQYIYTFLKI